METKAEAPALEGRLLARVYAAILRWPCPTCGQPAPCPCDAEQANAETTPAEAVTDGRA